MDSIEKNEHDEYEALPNEEYMSKLALLSFKFSQGDPVMHYEIMHYVKSIRPAWRMSDDYKDRLIKIASNSAMKFFKSTLLEDDKAPKTHEQEQLNEQAIQDLSTFGGIGQVIEDLQGILNDPPDEDYTKESLVRAISYGIISRDHRFLVEQKGRPRSNLRPQQLQGPGTDPFLSHTFYYGMEGHDTKVAEFNEMFQDVGKYLKQNPAGPKFAEVKAVYMAKSPNAPKV